MKCIFCEKDSNESKSVEHIIPESLGNTEHTLPRGVVCDACNNYIARKIEKPLLDSSFFKHLRQRQSLRNKRGRIPPIEVIIPKFRSKVSFVQDGDSVLFEGRNESHTDEITRAIMSNSSFTTYVPIPTFPDKKLMSRFLAKVSIEALVDRLRVLPSWQSEFFRNKQIALLRRYVRQGDKPLFWPFHERRIYDENHVQEERGEVFQVLHEWDFLHTESGELYCVICILGQEYSFNLGGPEISGYERWLRKENSRSPLYTKKNGASSA